MEEGIYVKQPLVSRIPSLQTMCLYFKKDLYGSKQAHRASYKCLNFFLFAKDIQMASFDKTLFSPSKAISHCWFSFTCMISSLGVLIMLLFPCFHILWVGNLRRAWWKNWTSSLHRKSNKPKIGVLCIKANTQRKSWRSLTWVGSS